MIIPKWHFKLKIIAFILSLHHFGYIFAFLAMFIEGDVTLFTVALLTHAGAFSLPIIFFTMLSGILIGDSLWYLFGKRFQNNKIFERLAKKLPPRFEELILKHPYRTFFISKFAYGFHRIILLKSGSLNLDFKKFAKVDYTVSTIWFLIIGSLGYFAGASLPLIKKTFKFGGITVALIILLLFFSEYLITYLWKKKINKNNQP